MLTAEAAARTAAGSQDWAGHFQKGWALVGRMEHGWSALAAAVNSHRAAQAIEAAGWAAGGSTAQAAAGSVAQTALNSHQTAQADKAGGSAAQAAAVMSSHQAVQAAEAAGWAAAG
jgi:hypothetical protein